MRFVGLVDPAGGVYQAWRVPQPQAPYPQDYIIDQSGVVRYWADRFDPQAVIATIDLLLGTGVEEPGRGQGPVRPGPELTVRPVAGGRRFIVRAAGLDRPARVEVIDALGRVVELLCLDRAEPLDWKPNLPAGSYRLRLAGARGPARPVVILR